MSKIRVVCGGQYGSESKGRTAGFLLDEAISPAPQLTIRVGGPQAGHIVVGRNPDDPSDETYHWKLRAVPVGAVCRPDSLLAIASGSEVDPERLTLELRDLDRAGYRASERIVLDPMATWMMPEHKQREVDSDLTQRLGSTSTGVGAVRCDRIMRTARTVNEGQNAQGWGYPEQTVRDLVNRHLAADGEVLVEAAQGCHLDLFRGPYPFATSGRTTAIDALAAAEVIPWAHPSTELQVWLAVRTFPIRVGGNSGPLQDETSWEELGLPPEITTVTKRIRRVGKWDPEQVAQSVEWCGGPPVVRLSISHLDYLFPEAATAEDIDQLPWQAIEWLDRVEYDTGAQIGLVGVSPSTTLVFRPELI